MDTKALYEKILGIVGPWHIGKINVDDLKSEIHVYLEYPKETEGECPECKKACALYDQREDRAWRHLDSCAYKTYIAGCPAVIVLNMEYGRWKCRGRKA